MHILSFGYHLFNFNLLFEKKRTNEDTERGLGVHCLLSCLFCLPPILMYLGLAMRKEGGQHHKYISYSYITCMCCFEHVNWSGKIKFSQGKIREFCFAIFVGTHGVLRLKIVENCIFLCILWYCSFPLAIFVQWSFKQARRLLKTITGTVNLLQAPQQFSDSYKCGARPRKRSTRKFVCVQTFSSA